MYYGRCVLKVVSLLKLQRLIFQKCSNLGIVILKQVIASAQTAAQRERTLFPVIRRWWMWDFQGAVYATTVPDNRKPLVVASITGPVLSTTAVEDSNRAAEHAFPVNVLSSMTLLAYVTPDAHFLHKAASADQIFFPCGFFHL